MADTMTAPEQAATTAPRRRVPRWLLALLVLLLVGGGGAAAWFLVLAPDTDPDADVAAPGVVEDAAPVDGAIVEVTNFTASLAGPEAHFAKVGFAVVLREDAVAETVSPRFPLLRDEALSVLARTEAAGLRSAEGQDRLRADLSAAAQQVWPDGEVLRVVLTELVVQ